MYLQGLSLTLQISLVAIIIGIALGIAISMVKVSSPTSRRRERPRFRGKTKSERQALRREYRLDIRTERRDRRAARKNALKAARENGFAAVIVLLIKWLFEFLLWLVLIFCNIYTTVIRGTPLMIQLLILYGFAWMPNGVIVAFLGFGLNSAAYVSETFRSGIQSVDGGQMEAARSLGLTRWQAMTSVVLPQAIKNVLPAIFNEFIVLVKETSVAGYVAVNELTKMANSIRNRTYDSVSLYAAALVYLLLTYILTQVLKVLERRFRKSDRS